MKLNKKIIAVMITAVSLSACNSMSSKHVACDDKDAVSIATQVLQENLDKTLSENLKDLITQNYIKDLDPAKLKLSAKSVQFSLVDSRTEHVDPNSPKTECTIDLTATLPSDLVKKADDTRVKLNEVTVAGYADSLGLDYEGNKIKLELMYTIQPTDKGDKILVKLKNQSNMLTLISNTLTYAFIKPQIEKNQIRSLHTEAAPVDDAPDDYYEGD